MRSFWNVAFARAASIVVVAAVFLTTSLDAQTPSARRDFRAGMRTGFGYTGVMPDAILGAGGFHLLRGSAFGLFADVNATALSGIRKNDSYCPAGITVCTTTWVLAERNDQHVDEEKEWLVFNAGVVYTLTPEFALLLGGGVGRETRFQEFFDDNPDPDVRLTDSGAYYVDDELSPEWKPQAVMGFLLRAGQSLAFRVGYQTAVGGLSFGAYFVLP